MVTSIIQQDDRFQSPIRIFAIKMGTQLGQEKSKSKSIGLTNIDSIDKLSRAA